MERSTVDKLTLLRHYLSSVASLNVVSFPYRVVSVILPTIFNQLYAGALAVFFLNVSVIISNTICHHHHPLSTAVKGRLYFICPLNLERLKKGNLKKLTYILAFKLDCRLSSSIDAIFTQRQIVFKDRTKLTASKSKVNRNDTCFDLIY